MEIKSNFLCLLQIFNSVCIFDNIMKPIKMKQRQMIHGLKAWRVQSLVDGKVHA